MSKYKVLAEFLKISSMQILEINRYVFEDSATGKKYIVTDEDEVVEISRTLVFTGKVSCGE